MTKQSQSSATGDNSTVRIKFMDPLGGKIEGLKYQVREGDRIVAKGVTDKQGSGNAFTSPIGAPIVILVEHFITKEMRQIRTLIPWAESFRVKLLSGKIKEVLLLRPAAGSPGRYERKTYIAKGGDTLDAIAKQHGTTEGVLARLNNIELGSGVQNAQVIKLPLDLKEDKNPDSAGVSCEDRGCNGTPKVSVALKCDKSSCIKIGVAGILIEEINIRLMGFGGTVAPGKPLDEFTDKTEAAVRQFQRDYMNVPETGKVCALVLGALDEFRLKFPIKIGQMKCSCGHCDGFGKQREDSSEVELYKNGAIIKGTEFPGMHRGLMWLFRAALFYTSVKDKELGYAFLRISSGYRCWNNNKAQGRKSTNHMGNALDLQFKKGASAIRCDGHDLEELRTKIFRERVGAQMRWEEKDRAALEAASDGANSWVHVDVRNYDKKFKDERYYAVTQGSTDGEPLMDMVRNLGLLMLLNCGGIPARSPDSPTDRMPIESLTVSLKGRDFIKRQENVLAITSADLARTVADIWRYIHVPLYQHEFDALAALVFRNESLRVFPKLVSNINTKIYSGASDEILKATGEGGQVLKHHQSIVRIFRNSVYEAN